MHRAFRTTIETRKTNDYTLDQFVYMLTDVEWNDKNNRKIARHIKNVRFHYKSSTENNVYDEIMNIDRNLIFRLAECDFIDKTENIIITGKTGVGKSYLVTDLGYQACNSF